MQFSIFRNADLNSKKIPPLKNGEIHIWLLDSTAELLLYPFFSLLTDEEKERLQLLKQKEDQIHYKIGHIALRKLLCFYHKCAPEHISIAMSPHGKPFLQEDDHISSPVNFNISHSGNYVLLGFSKDSPLGVDIEQKRSDRNLAKITKLFCHPAELENWASVTDSEQLRDLLFTKWTQKEALLKGIGRGLTLSPASFCITKTEKTYIVTESIDDFSSWKIVCLPAPQNYFISVAFQ